MGDVTGKAVRAVGYGEQWILDTTAGIPPLQIAPQDDGTVRLTFPSDVPDATLTTVKQRLESVDDTEAQQRRNLAAIIADLAALTVPADKTTALLREAALALGRLALGQGGAASTAPQ